MEVVFLGKTDLSGAFRVLPLRKDCYCWLVMKAMDPKDNNVKYFVEKCLPFGASISCSHYQRFSNALKHLVNSWGGGPGKQLMNYLDDFLFLAYTRFLCNQLMGTFLKLCEELNIPVATEKTEKASMLIVFLGILLNGHDFVLALPIKKQTKALKLLNEMIDRKKATVKQLQTLTGYLNFLTRSIFAGRTFTRRMYSKFTNLNKKLKPHHHIKLDAEFKLNCTIWQTFLTHYQELALCRPMVDVNKLITSDELAFYSDASANERLGMGAVYGSRWMFVQWEPGYIKCFRPSIEYLELYAVVAAVLTWGQFLQNRRMILFCDNSAVVGMLNNMSSSCKNCMFLLRILTLNNLINNRRVFAK